jgi:hypothetical protein
MRKLLILEPDCGVGFLGLLILSLIEKAVIASRPHGPQRKGSLYLGR